MLVIDASVAVKWVVPEPDSDAALALLGQRLLAPELLAAEFANILWKKVRLGHLTEVAARAAAGGLKSSKVEFVSMQTSVEEIVSLAIQIDHPAYDCAYLVLARQQACPFVTADRKLAEKISQTGVAGLVVHALGSPGVL